MKYHDSIKQAERKMLLVSQQLQKWQLAPTPINYAVCYEFIHNRQGEMAIALVKHYASHKKIDNFFIEDLFQQYLLGQSQFREEIITDIDELLSFAESSSEKTISSAESLVYQVDSNIEQLASRSTTKIAEAIKKIKAASLQFKRQQQELNEELAVSKEKSEALRIELEAARKEIYLDPLTGLYNRKALNKHLEVWSKEEPNKPVAAIVLNVDQLTEVNKQFGDLISDVLLTKIANKVGSYVGESGLPVRSGSDEFIVLLPEVEKSAAAEIGEKIRQGVEKLRFVSSKSGVRFPQMTVSLAINSFNLSQNVDKSLSYTRSVLSDLQLSGGNQLTVAN